MNPLILAAVLGTLLLPAPPPDLDLAPPRPATADREPAHTPDAVWPLTPKPQVVAGFERPSQVWSAGHRGVDLLGSAGDEVRAALAGTVIFAGPLAGRGVVVISHGTSRTTYEPVAAGVHLGDQVETGSAIGTLQEGLSHCAPRACLHWGLIENGGYEDPLSLLGSGRVRLLPLGTTASPG